MITLKINMVTSEDYYLLTLIVWCGFAIKEFVWLKLKMYSFLAEDNNKHENTKCVNKDIVEKISDCKYKDALLNQKHLRHSMNRI